MNNSYTALYRLSAWPVSEAWFLYAHEKEAECLRSCDRSPNGLDWGSPFHSILLHYQKFCDKVAKSSSFVEPQSLPPTIASARYHSLLVYYQVQLWKGNELKPEEWGWKHVDSQLRPKLSDLPPAPDDLLKTIILDVTATKTVHGLAVHVSTTSWNALFPVGNVVV